MTSGHAPARRARSAEQGGPAWWQHGQVMRRILAARQDGRLTAGELAARSDAARQAGSADTLAARHR